MNATDNGRCVTIYVDNEGDVEVFRRLTERARKAGISFGSVGIIPKPPGCNPVDSNVVRFLDFPHRWSEIKELVLQDGIPSDFCPKRTRLSGWEIVRRKRKP